jgi:hypothetical protein
MRKVKNEFIKALLIGKHMLHFFDAFFMLFGVKVAESSTKCVKFIKNANKSNIS